MGLSLQTALSGCIQLPSSLHEVVTATSKVKCQTRGRDCDSRGDNTGVWRDTEASVTFHGGAEADVQIATLTSMFNTQVFCCDGARKLHQFPQILTHLIALLVTSKIGELSIVDTQDEI
jgi:hypothetical protein